MADDGLTLAIGSGPRRRALLARLSGGRFFSTSVLLLAARLAGAAAGFLVQLLLARWLSPHALGIYFAATSLAVVGGVLAAHGYPGIATRFVSRYRRPSGAPLLRAFVRHIQKATIVLAAAITAVVALVAIGWPGLSGEARIAVALAAAIIPFVAAFRLYGSLATATRSFKLAYLPDVCLKPMLVLVALGALLLGGHGISLVQVMACLAAATVVLSVAQFVILKRDFPVALLRHAAAQKAMTVRRVVPKWQREAHAVLLVAIFAQFLPELSILTATPILSTQDVGIFGLCLKLAFLVGFFVFLTQNMATPDLADALAKRSQRRGGMKLATQYSAAAGTFAATIAAIVWGDDILAIFGPDFVAGHVALVLLVAAQLLRALFGPTSTVLTLVGEQKINLLLTIASIAVLAGCTALGGYFYSLDGAASAVLLTVLFWSASSAYALHRRTGLRVDLLAGVRMRRSSAATLQAPARA